MEAYVEALKQLPDDFLVKQEAFTRTTYRAEYEAIDPTRPELSQAGKVIIITGASQGIGANGLAKQFARAKPKAIVLAARNEEKLTKVAAMIQEIDPAIQLLSVPTDVTVESSVEKLFELVKEQFGHADVLVNNAGVSVGLTNICDMDLSDWWTNFDVNVKGTLIMTKHFLRLLGSNPGTVINISSTAAWNTQEDGAGYCLSKLAAVNLAKHLSNRPNLVAVALSPGMVDTDIVPPLMRRFALDQPELPGGVAVWLASDQGKFMNGRYMSANWSVTELLARQKEILEGDKLKAALVGRVGQEQFQDS